MADPPRKASGKPVTETGKPTSAPARPAPSRPAERGPPVCLDPGNAELLASSVHRLCEPSAGPERDDQPVEPAHLVAARYASGHAGSRYDGSLAGTTISEVFESLRDLRMRVTTTPFEESERLDALRALSAKFARQTSGTAEGIAHEYHAVRSAGEAAASSMRSALHAIRPDGSLRLVSGGLAGGVKVADDRNGAFFKISEDQHGFYGGNRVMADKPAKHELAALSHVHDVVDSLHVTAPLVSCVDVAVRGNGGGARVYRVQAFSLLPIDSSTLRLGSGDGAKTAHACAQWLPVATGIAEAFHLAPSSLQPRSGTVHAHSYAATTAKRDPELLENCGDAAEASLARLGAGRVAVASSGLCASIEAEHGVTLDSFVATSSEHTCRALRLADLSPGDGMLSGALSGVTEGPQLRLPLPFDVEGHMLPTGERVLADTHRLCIPEVVKPSGGSVCVVVSPSGIRVTGMDDGGPGDLVPALSSVAGRPSLPSSDESHTGCGCRCVAWDGRDGEAATHLLVSRPHEFWQAQHLTLLFPPSAAAILRDGGVPRVSPDVAIDGWRAGDPIVRATAHLLSPDNLALAASAVVASVLGGDGGEGWSPCPGWLRSRVKAGLHSRGLGLRHVFRVWDGALTAAATAVGAGTDGGGRSAGDQSGRAATQAAGSPNGGTPAGPARHDRVRRVEAALVSACLPRPGSSAGMALERMMTGGPRGVPWLVACLAARAASAKGLGMRLDERVRLAEAVVRVSSAGRVCLAWLWAQRRETVSVKAAGLGGRRGIGSTRLRRGRAAKQAHERLRASLWQELRHRQLAGNDGEAAVLMRIGALSRASSPLQAEGLLCAWRRAGTRTADHHALHDVALTLSGAGDGDAAVQAAEVALSMSGRTGVGSDTPRHVFLLCLASCLQAAERHARAATVLEECRRLQASSLGSSHPEYINATSRLAGSLWRTGRHDQSVELLEECVGKGEASLPRLHPTWGLALADLANRLSSRGEHGRALSMLEEALDIVTRSVGKHHPTRADVVGAIAECLTSAGDYDRALEFHQACLDALEPALGAAHPRFAASQSAAASCHFARGELGRAKLLLELCCETRSACFGKNHPTYASTLISLAAVLEAQGEFSRAIELLQTCRDALGRSLGTSHPTYATVLNNLATCFNSTGEHGLAVTMFEKCRDIRKAAFGPVHPDYAACLNNLAMCMKEVDGVGARSVGLLEECASIQASTLGPSHPTYLATLRNLALCLESSGQEDRAVEVRNECAQVEASLSPQVAMLQQPAELNSRAGKLLAAGEFDKARDVMHRCRSLLEVSVGRQHPLYATATSNLAASFEGQGSVDRAMELHEESRAIRAAVLGTSHPDYALSLRSIASCMSRKGKNARALELFGECQRIQEASLGPGHPAHAATLNNMAACMASQGRTEEAMALSFRAVDIARTALGADHPHTRELERTYHNVMTLL